ncbi:MAG: PP2C family protein-serine/threonine phosphatase [Oscillospiraceae bacterium]
MDKKTLKVRLDFPSCGVNGISAASVQCQGAREYQEDSCGFTAIGGEPAEGFCAVVADGMGGLNAGAFVSNYAVNSLLTSNVIGSGEAPLPEQLLGEFRRISGEIAAGGSRGGTTLAAVVCQHSGVYFCSCGDSRIYLLRGGVLTRLTEDQDYFSVLLDRVIDGRQTFQQAESDPDKESLAQFIGSGTLLIPDRNIIPLKPQPGDRLLICSDGVYNALCPNEIMQSLTLSAGGAAEDIAGRVLAKGYTNQDNFTAVTLEFLPGETADSPQEQPKVRYDSCDLSTCTSAGGCPRNEDSFFTGGGVFAVADGLGGHSGVEKASAAAVGYISTHARNFSTMDVNALYEGANTAVREAGEGMSTIAAGFVNNGEFRFGNVGDSRVYFLRGGRIIAQTKDHSVCQAAVELGQLDPEQIRFSEDRSRLLKALGSEERLNLRQGYDPIAIQPGDSFLICSDGFWEYVHEQDMECDRLKSTTSAEWLRRMVKRRLLSCGDGGDNYTAVCGIFTDQPSEEKPKKRRIDVRLLLAGLLALVMLGALAGALVLLAGGSGEGEENVQGTSAASSELQ